MLCPYSITKLSINPICTLRPVRVLVPVVAAAFRRRRVGRGEAIQVDVAALSTIIEVLAVRRGVVRRRVRFAAPGPEPEDEAQDRRGASYRPRT